MTGMPLTLFLIVAVVLTALYLRRLQASGVELIKKTGGPRKQPVSTPFFFQVPFGGMVVPVPGRLPIPGAMQ